MEPSPRKMENMELFLRNRTVVIIATAILGILALCETLLAVYISPFESALINSPGIWFDILIGWICVMLLITSIINLKNASFSMIAFTVVAWIIGFTVVCHGVCYTINGNPYLSLLHWIYESLTYVTTPFLLVLFWEYLAIEIGREKRYIHVLTVISQVAFVLDMILMCINLPARWIFFIDEGGYCIPGDLHFLNYIYPALQIILSSYVVVMERDFTWQRKATLLAVPAAPTLSFLLQLLGVGGPTMNTMLLILLLFLHNVVYTRRGNELLLRIIERKDIEAYKDKRNISMLRALSDNYAVIWTINAQTGEYDAHPTDSEFARQIMKLFFDKRDFFANWRNNINKAIYEEDRVKQSVFYSKENMERALMSSEEYTADSRVIIDNKVVWYRVKLVKGINPDGSDIYVIGIMDLKETRYQEMERQRYIDIIENLSADFETVSYISLTDDSTKDTIQEYRVSQRLERNINGWKEEENFHNKLNMLMENVVHKDDRGTFFTLTRKVNIMAKLEEENFYAINFRAILDGSENYYQMKYTANRDDNGKVEGIIMGIHNVDSVTRKELEVREQIERIVKIQTKELREMNMELNDTNEAIVDLLGSVVEGRDAESGSHIKRMKRYTYIIGEEVMKSCPEYGLGENEIKLITFLAALHDIGKIAIPDNILLKKGPLTEEEFEIMKTHCEKGCEILQEMSGRWELDYLNTSMEICRFHHEKWDGSGYPIGLKGNEIPISAQIVSVADCFDALTSERVYKGAYSGQEAFDMILNGECGEFSPQLKECIIRAKEKLFLCLEGEHDFDNAIIRQGGLLNWMKESDVTSEDTRRTLEGIQVLLVDDETLTREINREALEEEGAIVTEAPDGIIALEKFKNKEYDIVLMDMIMPVMEGVSCIKTMREMEIAKGLSYAENVPIIGLTAYNTETSTRECLVAGGDACISKPLTIKEFINVYVTAVKKRSDMMEEKLRYTIKEANTDTLTRVKNLSAYMDQVALLAEDMGKSTLKFGVVISDINDLKKVNDTYGHDVGDIYIKNCCRIICSVFKHSPVYRIGGDEFAVIVQGGDYDNIARLMLELENRVAKASQEIDFNQGRASIASGYALYDRKIDKVVGNVKKRADEIMYANKAKNKRKLKQ